MIANQEFAALSVATDGIPTISSLQISEITGKKHADVMRDIRTVFEQAEIGLSKFAASYLNAQNKEQPCYHLPRRECDLVISGYSVKYRLAIIDRWRELEKQVPAPSLPEMLRLAATAMEENERLKITVSEQEPKVEALRLLSISDGSTCISRAAKSLGVEKVRDLFDWLHEKKWIFKRGGEWIAHQDRLRSGHLEDKTTTVERTDGSSKTVHQTLVTPKGLARLAEIFSGNQGGVRA